MISNDFAEYAQPIIDILENDPDLPTIDHQTQNQIFNGSTELDGKIIRVDNRNSVDSILEASPPPDQKSVDAARDAYPMVGIDILAFYKSFRFRKFGPFKGQWGIFLIDAGVAGLSAEIQEIEKQIHPTEAKQLAIDLLLAHERYHFWIDTWTLGQEITSIRQTLYKKYEPYLMDKKSVELTTGDYEESLANYYAFNNVRRKILSNGKSAANAIRKILNQSPIPYSNFSFSKDKRCELEGYLAIGLASGRNAKNGFAKLRAIDPSILSASLEPVDVRHPIASSNHCPAYYVEANNYSKIVQPYQGPELKELKRFVTNYLGGKFINQTDHEYYRIDNQSKIKIPNPHDKAARRYELTSILLKAGMTHKEFREESERTDRWTQNCPRKESKTRKITK